VKSWLRRNLVALIVIGVSLPALAYVFVAVPLLDSATEPAVTTVRQGDPFEVGGYTFTLTASQEFPGAGTGSDPGANAIPLGTSIVGAIITAEPTGEPIGDDAATTCDTELTSRTGGEERTWSTVSSPTDFDYGVGSDRTTSCSLDGDPFELETVFLTPDGVYDHATVDLTVGSETFRLALVHE
jgi:hypothetical protein